MLDLTSQEKRELMYISLILLVSGGKEGKGQWKVRDATVPEVLHIVDPDVFLELMKNFSGQWIKIPTIKEMERAAKVIFYYYHTEIEGASSEDALELIGLKRDDRRSLSARVGRLKKFFKENSFKIPDRLCSTEFLKKINIQLCMDEKKS